MQWLRQQPDQQELVLAAYYDDPLLGAADRYWQSGEWKEICRFLPDIRFMALDVGAGRGIASYALAREGFSKVVALEPDTSDIVGAAAIRLLAQQTDLPIEVIENFSEELPFDTSIFDIVFVRAVLHHTQDLEKACSEFFRVLRPGGKLIAVREHVISKPEDLPLFFEMHPLHNLYGGENAYVLEKYRNAIKDAGFQSLIELAPLTSVINFAPYTLESLQGKIAEQLTTKAPKLRYFVLMTLSIFWPILRPALNMLDNRPGRHYSFVAVKG